MGVGNAQNVRSPNRPAESAMNTEAMQKPTPHSLEVTKEPVKPRVVRVTDTDDQSDEDYLLASHPFVPALLEDGTLPREEFAKDIAVQADLVNEQNFVSRPGDQYLLVLADIEIPGTRVTLGATLPEKVDLVIPKSYIDQQSDGRYHLWYRVIVARTGEVLASQRQPLILDRHAAGGSLLPPVIFSEDVVNFGISLPELMTLPEPSVSCIVPDYNDSAEGDELQFSLRLRGGAAIDAGKAMRASEGAGTPFSYPLSALQKIDKDGIVEFFYHVRDHAGNLSQPSASMVTKVLVKDAPGELLAPAFVGMEDRLLTDGDVRPALYIAIPPTVPACRPGDRIHLQLGEKQFLPIELESSDPTQDPMVVLEVAYADVLGLIDPEGATQHNVSGRYYITRDGVRMTSPKAIARLNLDTPGGYDPDPTTPAHEGLGRPTLKAAQHENYVDADEIDKGAIAQVPENVAAAAPSLRPGDVLTILLDGVAVSEPVTLTDVDAPIAVRIEAAALRANVGTPMLSYSVSRMIDESHEVIVSSLQQSVEIHDERSTPGKGLPPPKSVSPAARRRLANHLWYGLGRSDLAPDKSSTVRVYAWDGMAVGDEITLAYTGFNRTDGGDPLPESTGTLSHTVTTTDLHPRQDDSLPEKPATVHVDFTLPGTVMLPLGIGRIHFTHTVKNRYGTSARSPEDIVETEFRT